jgi:hypothetical protein
VKQLRAFGHFWYDFIVGDDWTIAAAVVVAVALTTLLAHHGRNPWPLVPLAVAAILTWSVWRVARAHVRKPRED